MKYSSPPPRLRSLVCGRPARLHFSWCSPGLSTNDIVTIRTQRWNGTKWNGLKRNEAERNGMLSTPPRLQLALMRASSSSPFSSVSPKGNIIILWVGNRNRVERRGMKRERNGFQAERTALTSPAASISRMRASSSSPSQLTFTGLSTGFFLLPEAIPRGLATGLLPAPKAPGSPSFRALASITDCMRPASPGADSLIGFFNRPGVRVRTETGEATRVGVSRVEPLRPGAAKYRKGKVVKSIKGFNSVWMKKPC